jgi:ABC-2 type transport system ATP-binding protein
MIQVEGLTKYYGPHPAIQDIKFHAKKGEILGFLGPNGAGKTTTMRILTGYMPPTSGQARVAGFDVVEQSLEVRRRVGYLPETVPLYGEMSVVEYFTYMGSLRRVKNLDERIERVLGEVGLMERADSYIEKLSKGLRQRVGIAQAMLHDPEVLILDEPTLGLDPAQIIEVRKLIRELGRKRTVLLSTHILTEAQQVCDRVLIIHRGHIMAEDSPANLQAKLSGGARLRLHAKAKEAELIALLKKVPGVASVQTTESKGVVEIGVEPGKDVRAEVARSIVGAGLDLLELSPAGISLEQIFLQLTGEQITAEEKG